MSDDLVRRLRDRGVCSLEHNSCRNDLVCDQAADRIEELEKRADTFAEGWREERLKMIDAEDKLATAVEALVHIAGKQDYADDPWSIARTTLAELKGDPDA